MKKPLKKFHIFKKKREITPNKCTLAIFIVVSLVLAGGMVGVSLFLYNTSGAAQLDLSRPGYVSVRSQASSAEAKTEAFSSDGKINESVIEDFKKMFNKQASEAKSSNAFSGDPLNTTSLGLEVVSAQPTN